MNPIIFPHQAPSRHQRGLITIGLVILLILSCTVSTTSGEGSGTELTRQVADLQLTQSALMATQNVQVQSNNMQATQLAMDAQATLLAQQATQLAQPPQAPTADVVATQVAATLQAGQNPPSGQSQPPPDQAPSGNLGDFDTWKKSASILLFEDMAGVYDTTRWIQETLDAMGLSYEDAKDGEGRFKNSLLKKGTAGTGWDLVIAASEARNAIQGEFFDYLNTAISDGSAVIVEHWAIDSISAGKISTTLSRCGVRFQADWFSIGQPIPPAQQVLYPYDGTSPILHEPNEDIRISNPTNYWWNWMLTWWGYGDYGDFLEKLPGSDAVIVLGQKSQDKTRYATLVSCHEGRVIFWTASTHSYGHDRIILLWENMIHNALKARYNYLNK